jgi:Xaa-Pro dipeptidase
MTFNLSAVQSALVELGFDGWLFYDFRGSNLLARRILNLDERVPGSRRFFYFVPARGEPKKLVHRIESGALDHLPGERRIYLKWQELEAGVGELVRGTRRVAMEYSPRNAIPYISRIDAGTVELVRAAGAEIFPSGNLIQLFEAVWTEEQWQMHLEAAQHTRSAFDRAFALIARQVRASGSIDELTVQKAIMDHFQEHGLTTYHPPIVAVGPHSGDPHYETGTGKDTLIKQDTFVLIDLWAKLDRPEAVYSDLTHVGYVGQSVPEPYEKIFRIVANARDAAIRCARDACASKRPLQGWEVDQAAREVIERAGYGEFFVHRTGHSIGQEVHGNGANMDNLETREDRLVMRRTCFSVEPGIYLPEFGIRSEVNVFIDSSNQVHVTGGDPQQAVLPILTA